MANNKHPLQQLRELIKEGFREYDGDIMEEATEHLDALEAKYNDFELELEDVKNQRDKAVQDKEAFQDECIKLKNQISINSVSKRIEFGVGALHYSVEADSAITIQELMDVIQKRAMLLPVADITNAIIRGTRETF